MNVWYEASRVLREVSMLISVGSRPKLRSSGWETAKNRFAGSAGLTSTKVLLVVL